MKKSLLFIYNIYFIALAIILVNYSITYAQNSPINKGDDINGWMHQRFLMLRDPKTNRIPANIRKLELEYAKTLPKRREYTLFKNQAIKNVQALSWTERGPSNVGGRTLAIGIDIKDTSIVLAGAASGGIWRSTNSGASWTLVTSPSSTLAVTSLVQNTKSGKENTWYAGTGEFTGTEFDDKGQTNKYLGSGIYKSTDDGVTWTLLSSTAVSRPDSASVSGAFSYVNGLAIDTVNSDIYAATYDGIQESTDGGSTWNVSLNDNSYYTNYSQVAVTSTGIVYATIGDSTLNSGGIWKSTNAGSSWKKITPSGLTSYNRIVIGISPSSENIVYFFGQTPGQGKLGQNGDYLSLWKYDTSGSSATWTNLSSNLPSAYGSVAGLNSQGSYNLFVTVAPNSSDTVIIGTTNMYRSTNGFTDTTATKWIGGYSPANDVSLYPNSHSDFHTLIFQPGSNIVAYSGHDGGISRTDDITASNGGNTPISWDELDSTYDVTQFYSVSIAPESGSNVLAGGAQDNGNHYTTSAGLSSWTAMPEGGDGQYDVVAPSSDDRIYGEYQNGGIFAIQRNNTYLFDFAPPSGTYNKVNQLFTNPFALDPNNSSILYYAGGSTSSNSGIWRNGDVKNSNSTTVNSAWTQLSSTIISGAQVSAIGISTANSANVVYYGTSNGHAYRIDTANTGSSPTVTDITSSSFPSGAYVSCIAVDSSNSDKAMLLFSNYDVKRIWYTTDGGSNWTDESGNLSANTAPSVRWAEIFDVGGVTHYFLATSTGVYYTTTLNGSSTTWTQEATTSIGNAVCSMLAYRHSDHTLAVSTHGRGVFTAVISTPLPVELVAFSGYVSNNEVNLKWQTATEENNYGFDIERKQLGNNQSSNINPQWQKIGFVQGAGNSSSPKSYSFVDTNPLDKKFADGKVEYRLKLINNDGSFKYSEVVDVSLGEPLKYELSQNYPNPFNPTTTIKYQIPNAGYVTLKVYNILGQEVKTLVNENKAAGQYKVQFNGTGLASGIYFYRIKAGKFTDVKKLMLLK